MNVVLLEDLAAVVGVGVAMGCMGLTSLLGSHIPDAIGSCLIGGILAGVSGFIIYTNSAALVGKYVFFVVIYVSILLFLTSRNNIK